MSIKHLFLTLCGVFCLPLTAGAASDTTAPTVTGITPASVTKNVATTISATYHDNSAGVVSCTLFVNSVAQGAGAMDLSVPSGRDGIASQSYTYTGSSASFSVVISCTDQATSPNTGQSTPATIAVNSPGTVGSVSPVTATVNEATSFSAAYSGFAAPQTASGCWLVVDGATKYPGATLSGGAGSTNGTATKTYTFTTVGSHTAFISCLQNEGTYVYGPATTINVSAAPPGDTSAPTVGQIASITPSQNVAITISATYSDNVSVVSCTLFVNDVNWGTMNGVTGASGTATKEFAFNPAGTYTVYLTCRDAAGNVGTGPSRTVTVSGPPVDTTAPTVSLVAQSTATAGVATTLTATYSDNITVNSCQLIINGGLVGDSSLSASNFGTTTKSYTFPSNGSYQVQFRCMDSVGNMGYGTARTVTVTGGAAPAGDTSPPLVGNIWESSATAGTALMLHANAYDNVAVSSCDLYVNGTLRSGMAVSGGMNPSVSYTFSSAGTYTVYVQCRDAAGNVTNGPSQTLNVVAATLPIPPATSGSGRLVKAACPALASPNHPCKAVYYYGSDGKRHAFPNERVYFTWYTDFNTVDEVSDAYLATLPLGLNVTYRPGTRLVKFTTVNRVYAVSRGGILRWMTSEALANTLYGPSWNRMVDDIPDAFYTNYTFGADITSSGQYSPSGETAATYTIDANF